MAKIWKKLLIIVLVIACLFNIVSKLVRRYPLKEEMKASAEYMIQNDSEKVENK